MFAVGTVSAVPVGSPTGETDPAKFVRLTRALEANPMQDTTKEMRTWLINWATESPDVSVKICLGFDLLPTKDEPFDGIFLTQSLFGNAAFQIEHPHKKTDQLAQQVAGIESVLKSYSALKITHPDKQFPMLDMLLQRQRSGELAAFLAPVVTKKCSDAP